jgi:hypothetical protein
MKFIQDLNDNLYNLDLITAFECEYDEDSNTFDLMIAQGSQRYLVMSEVELYRCKPEKVIQMIVGCILEETNDVISNEKIHEMADEYIGRFKK